MAPQSSTWALTSTSHRYRIQSFQRRGDEKLLQRSIVFNAQHIRLAADLAVFDIVLPPSCGFVDRSRVPYSAARTLKACFHNKRC